MSLSHEQLVHLEQALLEAAAASAQEAKTLLSEYQTRLSHEQLVHLEQALGAAAATSSQEAKALLAAHLAHPSRRVTPAQVLAAARGGHMEFIVRLAERAEGTSADLIRLVNELSEFDAAAAQLAIGRRVLASPDCTQAFVSACLVMLAGGAMTGRDLRPEVRAQLDALALEPLTETVEALATFISEPRGDYLALDPFRALLAVRIVDVASREPWSSAQRTPGASGTTNVTIERLQGALGSMGVSDFLKYAPDGQTTPVWRLEDAAVRGVDRLYSALVLLKLDQGISVDATAVAHLEAARSLLRQCGRSRGEAWACHLLARCLTEGDAALHDVKQAVANWDRAADLLESIADVTGAADMSEKSGHILIGEHAQPKAWGAARVRFARAAALYATAGDTASEGNALYWEGWCVEPMNNPEGDWRVAIDLYARAAQCGKSANDHERESRAQHALGWSAQPDHNPGGDWATAARHYEAALELRKGRGDALAYAKTAHRLAVCLAEGNRASVTPRARMLFSDAAVIRESEAPELAAESWEWIGGKGAANGVSRSTVQDIWCEVERLLTDAEAGLQGINVEYGSVDSLSGVFSDSDIAPFRRALTLAAEILRKDPEFMGPPCATEHRWGLLDTAGLIMEGTEPGSVQEHLGLTRLFYFGKNRIRFTGAVNAKLRAVSPQVIVALLRAPFRSTGVPRAGFVIDVGQDARGRHYFDFYALERPFVEMAPDGALGDLGMLQRIKVYSDGTCVTEDTMEVRRKDDQTPPQRRGFWSWLRRR